MIIWGAAYTEPRKEFQAQGEIKRLGFETFLPVLTRTKMVRRKKMLLSEAVFSRYLFVAFDPAYGTYGAVKRAKGVVCLLENQSGPQRVPFEAIERFRQAERAGAFDMTKPKTDFVAGQEVKITEGPFAGLIAKVRSASPSKRVKLLMRLLGGDVPLEINAEDLQKVG